MRKDWDRYFMDIAFQVRERSTCPRLSVGAIIVNDKRIKGSGYNGSPPGVEHCDDVGCLMIENHCKRTIHAEANTIMETSPEERKGATIYVTAEPCIECAKLIAGSGISRVVYAVPYPSIYDYLKDCPWIEVVCLGENYNNK